MLAKYFGPAWEPLTHVRGGLREPGHQFEWSWLLRWYERLSGCQTRREALLLLERAWRVGRDESGFLVDECHAAGPVTKPSRHLWPHTEAIKPMSAGFERAGPADAGVYAQRADDMFDRMFETFLAEPVAGGWIDHVDAAGRPLAGAMPPSSL